MLSSKKTPKYLLYTIFDIEYLSFYIFLLFDQILYLCFYISENTLLKISRLLFMKKDLPDAQIPLVFLQTDSIKCFIVFKFDSVIAKFILPMHRKIKWTHSF